MLPKPLKTTWPVNNQRHSSPSGSFTTLLTSHLVVDPEHDLVVLAHELDQHQGLLQLHPLVGQLGEQQLPETVQLVWGGRGSSSSGRGGRGRVRWRHFRLTAALSNGNHNSLNNMCAGR